MNIHWLKRIIYVFVFLLLTVLPVWCYQTDGNEKNEQTQDKNDLAREITLYLGDNENIRMKALFIDKSKLGEYCPIMIMGDHKTALMDPLSIVVSEKLANNIFDNKRPQCVLLKYRNQEVKLPLVIKGVTPGGSIKEHYDIVLSNEMLSLLNQAKAGL